MRRSASTTSFAALTAGLLAAGMMPASASESEQQSLASYVGAPVTVAEDSLGR